MDWKEFSCGRSRDFRLQLLRIAKMCEYLHSYFLLKNCTFKRKCHIRLLVVRENYLYMIALSAKCMQTSKACLLPPLA